MKVIYNKKTDTIRCVATNRLIAFFANAPDGTWTLDIDRGVPMAEATKIFQRWHSAHIMYNSSAKWYVEMINDALTERLYLYYAGRRVPVYWRGEVNTRGISMMCNALGMEVTDEFSCRHDIETNSIHYWLSKMSDRAEIPITKQPI